MQQTSSRMRRSRWLNINNGERLDTYVIKGKRGSGAICLNGAAARKVQIGDILLIMSYATMEFEEAKKFQSKDHFPRHQNKQTDLKFRKFLIQALKFIGFLAVRNPFIMARFPES